MTFGSEEDFKGVVDLINESHLWNEGYGYDVDTADIPEIAGMVELHARFIEAAAEADELMDEYLRRETSAKSKLSRPARSTLA